MEPQFQALQHSFNEQLARVASNAAGAAPEQVVVLETTRGVDDFRRAAERAKLKWLGEFDIEDTAPDDDFFDEGARDKPLSRRLYLTIANQGAISQLLSIWERWKSGGKAALPKGYKKWGDLISCLRDVRKWGPQDRLFETGAMEDWAERLAQGEETIRFQAELWYREQEIARSQVRGRIASLLTSEGGSLIAECEIAEINYHGILAELPIAAIQRLLADSDADLVLAEDVMFFRPCTQGALRPVPDEGGEETSGEDKPLPTGAPVVALLDGLPIENHTLLVGRIVVDDPDGWSATYPVADRDHGTAMASLIALGDLADNGDALPSPVYVRPVIRPKVVGFDGRKLEIFPEDQLAVDAVHQAVRRLCDPQSGGFAESVRVVNISLGDSAYPFHGFLSPWARLLDWLSYKYGILFVVSAGNCLEEIELGVTREVARSMNPLDLQSLALTAVATSSRHRGILAPGEGVNVLTVGASSSDASGLTLPEDQRELIQDPSLPATYSRLGLGYRRSIKPDLLASGGKGWYRESTTTDEVARFALAHGRRGAGLQHACPSSGATATSHTGRTVGTSNAAALCSRSMAFAYEALRPLLGNLPSDRLLHGHEALLLRALAVHTADWSEALSDLGPILENFVSPRRVREHMARFVGYGMLRADRMMACTEQRATVLGLGALTDGDAHEYRLPIPSDLGSYVGAKRLTVTLAWFTPINPKHRRYMRGSLWFDLPGELPLSINRTQCDYNAVQRGTIQHEILEGERASVLRDDSEAVIRVNCRAVAGALDEPLPYVLISSLEVGEGVEIRVYEEIRQRLMVRVRTASGQAGE